MNHHNISIHIHIIITHQDFILEHYTNIHYIYTNKHNDKCTLVRIIHSGIIDIIDIIDSNFHDSLQSLGILKLAKYCSIIVKQRDFVEYVLGVAISILIISFLLSQILLLRKNLVEQIDSYF